MPVVFDSLCSKGTNLDVALTRALGDVRDTARTLQAAEDSDYPTAQLRADLERVRARRHDAEMELHRHVAHCVDGCKRTTGQPNSAHVARQNPAVAAKPALPGGGELMARLADGDTLEDLATEYDRTLHTIRRVINEAGYRTGDLVDDEDDQDVDDDADILFTTFRWEPWMAHGRCGEVDPDLWFPEKGGSTQEAKAICHTCEVRTNCLNHALEYEERFGVWGGESERDRRRLALTYTPNQHQESA